MIVNQAPKILSWSSFGITDTGKIRKHNEDSMLNNPETGLWVVADGMGGHVAGDVASQMVVNALANISTTNALKDYLDNIEDCLIDVNKFLIEKAGQLDNKTTIGSTVVGMIAYEKFCIFFWAGDSRLYRLRDSTLSQLSIDHSQVELYIAQGIMNRAEAVTHPQGNVITRAIGANKNIYIDFDIQEMRIKDRYMLCSDGLTKHMKDTEFESMLNEGNSEEACRSLMQLTLERGATDNVTAIVIDIDRNE
ncbi:Protein serine/threonine phosphatase PrpC, regulation of stationary phase [uncultured Candidatus Thioglobus sp.]|nr:Protein serine/threonine phosphatase PrpC, regulation of stationary phase [uncultured Candidatus Thioglobus sp.]